MNMLSKAAINQTCHKASAASAVEESRQFKLENLLLLTQLSIEHKRYLKLL